MGLSVNGYQVADVHIEQLYLRQLAGAFELTFQVRGNSTSAPQASYWLTVYSARASLSREGAPKLDLGPARPDRPEHVRQLDHQRPVSIEFRLVLQPHQIAAIEEYRSAGDLRFGLCVAGEGGAVTGNAATVPVQDTLAYSMPRSKWIEILRAARAMDILLLEIPMPIVDLASKWAASKVHLIRAQRLFLNGDYPECVSNLRAVLETADQSETQLRNEALKKLGTHEARKEMTKREREALIMFAVRHYTQLAHHPDSSPGVEQYTRAEAELAVALSAALLSFMAKRELSVR